MEKQVYNYTQLFNNFSENLKSKRKQLGLTQKELAEIVGITPKTIQNYEKKKTIPTPALMEEISIALNVSFEEMIDNSELNNKVISAEILEKIENNSKYEFILEDLNITNKLFDIIDLEKRREMGTLPENVLNNTLGGKLDISYDEKYNLVQAKLQQELGFEIKKLENKLLSKYEDIKHVYRPVNVATGDTVDKKKY